MGRAYAEFWFETREHFSKMKIDDYILQQCLYYFKEQIDAGPVVGATCCAGCCASALAVPVLGPGALGACLPTCLATMGGFPPPSAFCAAIFLAPTP
ncbi:unnamed protein product [Rotaria magnacalcarata]|uniref:Uncharacterized protein n=1 Tax=Rotaria magnacalcarata TaxID=392030 RepID=A0A8S2QKQ8_9BILA|nr:unnamed protein product [Rotaria magnacalcarata]CAF5013162.1 unnamed protein product [Rotaria magnacalcarata]